MDESCQVVGIRSGFHYTCQRFIPISRSVGAERNDGLSLEAVAFSKGANNHQCCVPPYGATCKYSVVLLSIFHFTGNSRTGITITFFESHFGTRRVFGRIRYYRLDMEKVCTGLTDDFCAMRCVVPTQLM